MAMPTSYDNGGGGGEQKKNAVCKTFNDPAVAYYAIQYQRGKYNGFVCRKRFSIFEIVSIHPFEKIFRVDKTVATRSDRTTTGQTGISPDFVHENRKYVLVILCRLDHREKSRSEKSDQ